MLSARMSSWRVRSVHASVPYGYAQHGLKEPFQIWNFYAYSEHTHKKLVLMFRVHISSWRLRSKYPISSWRVRTAMPACFDESFFLSYVRPVHALALNAYAQCTHQFLTRMLSARTSSWQICSVHAPVLDTNAQCTPKFLTHMLSACISSWYICIEYPCRVSV